MSSKKIKYLLEERGRFYYQRKVPKLLVRHLGITRWHNPVGEDFAQAVELVSQMRREHDALILQVRENPDTLTQLRRKREVVERDREPRWRLDRLFWATEKAAQLSTTIVGRNSS